MSPDVLAILGDSVSLARQPEFRIDQADAAALGMYRALRKETFVDQQGLFDGHDHDDRDDDPRTVVLVARDAAGTVLGGVRLGPVDNGEDLGWWSGGRLVVRRGARLGIGAALVRAACAHAETAGVLRFEATVQARNERMFTRLGWVSIRPVTVAGTGHVLMRWPIGRIAALAKATKSDLGSLLQGLTGVPGFVGDDGVPVPGGHTQFGVPASLAVTALGRAANPVPGGGGTPGQRVRLTADLGGGWRPGYTGRQWDSTSTRSTVELRAMLTAVGRARPDAAKDVSMAGLAGTLGMLAEASGCGAVLDVGTVPRPSGATVGDWFTCFPGFAMLTVGNRLDAGPAVSAECGELVSGQGVTLRWPDGEQTRVIEAGVTGLGTS